ncbi:MAG: pca operon transcription factor PcaQ [Xanthobacteraceae bacterium]|nr:pca operon transcription factor PcaQ [Xanthobacteraceae bacterium]
MRSDRLKLRHLQTLLAIAEGGSLVRAAGKLGVTQPAVTKILAEMETIIGQQLVERTRQGILLTASGQILLRYATSSMRTIQEGLDSIARMQRADAPVIVVGALPNVGATVLPSAVRRFVTAFPMARLRIQAGSNAFLLASLRQGVLDLVIGRLGEPSDMQCLTFEQLYTESLIFVARPGHPLHAANPSLTDLRGLPLVLPDAGTRIRAIADEFFLSSGLALADPVIETIDSSFGRALVLKSSAVWCVPLGVVARDIRCGSLVRLNIDTKTTCGPVGITQRADHTSSDAIRILVEEVRVSAAAYRNGTATTRQRR